MYDAYWTIRRQSNSRSANSQTGQFLQTGPLADSELVNITFGEIICFLQILCQIFWRVD